MIYGLENISQNPRNASPLRSRTWAQRGPTIRSWKTPTSNVAPSVGSVGYCTPSSVWRGPSKNVCETPHLPSPTAQALIADTPKSASPIIKKKYQKVPWVHLHSCLLNHS